MAEWILFIAGVVLLVAIVRGIQVVGERVVTDWGTMLRLSTCVAAGLLLGLVLPVLGRVHWLLAAPILGVAFGAYTAVMPYPRPPIGRRLAYLGSLLGGFLLGRLLAEFGGG